MVRKLTAAILFFSTVSGFAQELVPAIVNGKYGYSRNGELVIQPVYDYATHFSEGLALVQKGGLWGYIDPQGTAIIEPEFTSAEPVHNGVAVVYRNGKWGLIRANGERILEPVYDSMSLDFNQSNFIYQGKFTGWCNSDFTFVTPMIYTKLVDQYDFLSGRKQNGKWDLYYKDKLILEDLDTPVDYTNFLWNSSVAFLRKKDHYGVYRIGEGWLFQPYFDTIVDFPVERYTIGDNYFDQLYLLGYRSENSDAAFPLSDFTIMLGDGKLLSPNHFHSISKEADVDQNYNTILVPDESMQAYLTGDQSVSFLTSELQLTAFPYPKVVRHLSWYIVDDPAKGKQCILDYERHETVCFGKIEQLRNYYPLYYGDSDTIPYDSTFVIEYLPYLAVLSLLDGTWKTALYSLEEQRIVSPYMTNPQFTATFEGSTDTWGYIYSDGGLEGFYVHGMKTGSDLKFKELTFLPRKRYWSRNPENGLAQLWEFRNGGLQLIVEDEHIDYQAWARGMLSRDQSTDGQVTRDDLLASDSPYADFTRTSNKAGKLGFICANGVRIPDSYDSLFQNASVEYFIDTYRDGHYGVINFLTGEVISPVSEIPMRILHSYMSNIDYALIEQDNGSYYIDKKGPFYGTVDDTWFGTFKRDGKMGLQMQSEFTSDTITIIPPIYKKLKYTTDVNEMVLYEATGANGKIGFVNQRGDTIVPLEYDGFKQMRYYSGDGLISRKGKKTGLVSFCRGVIVPPVFEEWEESVNAIGSADGFIVRKDDKVGLYSFMGKELLPCIYEDIHLETDYEAYAQYRLLQVLWNGKWYVQQYFFPNVDQSDCAYPKQVPETVDTSRFSGPFDLIIDGYYYRRTAPGMYDQYVIIDAAALSGSAVPESGIVSMREGTGVVLFVQNGKIGVRTEEGKVLVKPAFTNVMMTENGSLMISENGTNYLLDPYSRKRTKLDL